MISMKSKFAIALGVVGAIALAVPSAEARTKRVQPKAQNTAVSGASVGQQSFGRAFNYSAPAAGNSINFRDGRGGANYNPNQ